MKETARKILYALVAIWRRKIAPIKGNRVPCKTPGCFGNILPSTAEATGGFCRPCVNRAKAEEKQRYIEANRVEVNRFAGVSDPVEILRLIHDPPPMDPLVVQVPYSRSTFDVYRHLSQADVERLVTVASETPEMLQTVASYLSCFSTVSLDVCQRALLAEGDPYPPHAFREASESVVGALFELVERSVGERDDLLLDHALSALAWTRSSRVIEAMVSWSESPPEWSSLLAIPAHAYARVAGFEIESGAVRELTLPHAFELVPSENSVGAGSVDLFESQATGLTCPRCAQPATVLARLDRAGLPELRGRIPNEVLTCVECAPYGTVFIQRHAKAGWNWLLSDGEPAEGAEEWKREPRAATLAPRPPWEAVDYLCEENGFSQIGGQPTWIRDPEYPACPQCARSMPTVMQIALADFYLEEGIFYVHYCSGCVVVGVSYQTT